MTGRELITGALRLIGAIASGETASADEATDALSALNGMLDSWSLEKLILYARTEEVFTLVGAQQTYTIGSTGDFNTTRPLSIEEARIRVSNVDYPVEIIGLEKWSAIANKTLTSTYPIMLYPEFTNPLATLKFWPIPDAANSVVLWSWKTLTQIATLNTTIALPPGYERALRYNLAIELAPEYGKSVSAEVASSALESKSNIKRINFKPAMLFVDSALLGGRNGKGFNIYTGE